MHKRFKCSSCFRKCEATFEVLDGGEGTNPTLCIVDPDAMCAWTPIGESKPPKLTQAIFETDECPAWAEYAAVESRGYAYFFNRKPTADLYNGTWCLTSGYAQYEMYYGSKFDATDWSTSLIQRGFKKPGLPDWVYNAEYGYHQEYGYVRLGELLEWETKIIIMDTGATGYVCNNAFSNGRIVEARKRSFNAKEMQALVGKVFKDDCGIVSLVIGYDSKNIGTAYRHYSADDLLLYDYTIDGKPCYVLEHLNEKGEWVK